MTATGEAVSLGTAVLVGRFEDGSPEWHNARASVIGGSEVGSIMGINSFESRYVLWYRKAGFITKEDVANPIFEWGHRLEPVVAQKFADVHPEFDVQVSGSWVHKDRPWHGANPDRLLAPRYVYGQDEHGNTLYDSLDVEAALEIKTSMSGYGWERDMCPVKYVGQLRWYLECFGLEYGYLVVLVALGDYREFLVPRDVTRPVVSMQTGAEEWYSLGGQEMLDAVKEFYDSLPGQLTPEGTPPPLDGGTDTYELLRERHPDIINKDVEVTVELAGQLKAALEAEKAAIAEAQRMKNIVLDILGKNRRAIVPTADPKKPRTVARRQSKNGGKPYLVVA